MLDVEEWYMIKELRAKGMTISGIAKETGLSRNTVKKHLKLGKPALYQRKKKPSKLDPYREQIKYLIEHYQKLMEIRRKDT